MKGEAMGNQLNEIDDLFRKPLTTHKVETRELAWEKIDKRLNERQVPVWKIWGKWSVAAAVALTAISLYLFQPETEQKNAPFSTDNSSGVSSETLADLPDEENQGLPNPERADPETENEVSRPSQKAESFIAQNTKEEGNTAVPKGERSRQTKAISAEKWLEPVLKAPLKVDIPVQGVVVNSGQLAQSESETATQSEAYKIKIVSRGYAFVPEKENLVEEIESKIGGFLHKVDQGFSGIQDKKDHLFASLTSKNNQKK
jgi:hypothetical protein